MNARQRKKWLKKSGIKAWGESVTALIGDELMLPREAFKLAFTRGAVKQMARKRRR